MDDIWALVSEGKVCQVVQCDESAYPSKAEKQIDGIWNKLGSASRMIEHGFNTEATGLPAEDRIEQLTKLLVQLEQLIEQEETSIASGMPAHSNKLQSFPASSDPYDDSRPVFVSSRGRVRPRPDFAALHGGACADLDSDLDGTVGSVGDRRMRGASAAAGPGRGKRRARAGKGEREAADEHSDADDAAAAGDSAAARTPAAPADPDASPPAGRRPSKAGTAADGEARGAAGRTGGGGRRAGGAGPAGSSDSEAPAHASAGNLKAPGAGRFADVGGSGGDGGGGGGGGTGMDSMESESRDSDAPPRRDSDSMEPADADSEQHVLKKDGILKVLGKRSLTERQILDTVGDSRYTREVLRRLCVEKQIYRTGKGGVADPFLYTAAAHYWGPEKHPDGVAPEVPLEARLRRNSERVLACLTRRAGPGAAAAGPGLGGLTEREIRDEVGDNVGTGKALRYLNLEGWISRSGRGGATDPFRYELVPNAGGGAMASLSFTFDPSRCGTGGGGPGDGPARDDDSDSEDEVELECGVDAADSEVAAAGAAADHRRDSGSGHDDWAAAGALGLGEAGPAGGRAGGARAGSESPSHGHGAAGAGGPRDQTDADRAAAANSAAESGPGADRDASLNL